MNSEKMREQVHAGIDSYCSSLNANPYRVQRVLDAANKEGGFVVRKKLTVGLVITIVLLLTSVTALAIGLANYFIDFAALENTYGEYEQWPVCAKVELVDLMNKNGVLSVEESTIWETAQNAANKETAAENILAMHFSGMLFVDTYNAMTRELGPIEQWNDEQRALYTSILQKYNKQRTDWPVYMVPGEDDLTREKAVWQAKQAVLSMFSVSEELLNEMVVDAIFSIDEYNTVGAPLNEPFWEVDFGYGYAYRTYMTRKGNMLGISGPETEFYPWNLDILEGATEATPDIHDASAETAIRNAKDALMEIMNVPYGDVEAMDVVAKYIFSDLYCLGNEPVWLISYSYRGEVKWNVLLGYDGSLIDLEPEGKLFDQVKRKTNTMSLNDMWQKRCGELGMTEGFFNAAGDYYYSWTLEEKAAFYEVWGPIANAYEESQPYFHGSGNTVWEWTRNASGLPDDKAISQSVAIQIALDAIENCFGDQLSADEVHVFYYITNPEKPEWRIATATRFVTINAYTGEIMTLEQPSTTDGRIQTISEFLQYVIPAAQQNDTSDFSNEELTALLNLARENDIIVSDRLLLAMQNGHGYSEEETIMSLLSSEFGKEYCYWSLEQKYWFGEWMTAIGFRENNSVCLPDENSLSYDEAVQVAATHISAQTGDSVDDEARWRRNISYESIPADMALPTKEQAVSCFANYVTEVYGWPEATPALLETAMCEGEWKIAYEINMEHVKPDADMVTESEAITQTENGYRLTLYIGIDQDGVCRAAAKQGKFSTQKDKQPQWIMCFDPISPQDHAYQIVISSTGKVTSFDGQDVQAVKGSGDQIIQRYIAAYGGFKAWDYRIWAMLGDDLQETEADSVRCKLFQQAQFRLPPTDAIDLTTSAESAIRSVALENTTVRSTACCMDGDNPIWKIETITLNPEDIDSGKYTAIWILEIDCLSGEIREKREFDTANMNPLMTWLPFSFFEPDGIADEYSNG